MSYLVLARKWRPQVFEEVFGQRPITQTLQNAISQNRVAHAFLFTGARGVGKTSTARILAKALNCEAGPQINPCNHCTTCHEISSGISMDVIEIDGASNRGIDEIRELRENVRYTPTKSRYKIYIIDEVHMLTREAFNALLKTLEEPPSHILFVFATTEPHKIPATILSRCQRYDFKRIPLRDIQESLKQITEAEEIQISQRGLLLLAQESEGSLRDAQSLLDQVISYGGKSIRDEDITEVLGLIDRKILYDTIEAIAHKNPEKCMEMIEQVYRFGYDLQHYCRELLQYLRNLILIKVSRHPEGLMELQEEELGILKSQAERFEPDQLNHLFTLLLKGEEEVSQSTFPRTMLEMALIRMSTLRPILSIDEILKKLEAFGETMPSAEQRDDGEAAPAEKNPSTPSVRREKAPPTVEDLVKKEGPGLTSDKSESSGGSLSSSERSTAIDDSRENEGESQEVREETWKKLVDFTRAKNPILGSFLALGDLVHLSLEKIEIGFEKDSFHYDRMAETGNRRQLDSICQEYLQRKVRVIITPLDQLVRSKGRVVLEPKEPARDEIGKRLENGAEKNLLVQEALRLFSGRIVEQ